MRKSADLPNDIDALKALLLVGKQTLRQRYTVIAARDKLIPGLRAQLGPNDWNSLHLSLGQQEEGHFAKSFQLALPRPIHRKVTKFVAPEPTQTLGATSSTQSH